MMASKRRNMFYQDEKQETKEIDTCNLLSIFGLLPGGENLSLLTLSLRLDKERLLVFGEGDWGGRIAPSLNGLPSLPTITDPTSSNNTFPHGTTGTTRKRTAPGE
ncbi:hypothetical protein AAG570_011795 [Ranatra chinensis]|uniref:Uncharacterized protein n=1 Tax=Ranatra chinensis TaxID=642074 RepID=A0ABD0YIX9_9HEMI